MSTTGTTRARNDLGGTPFPVPPPFTKGPTASKKRKIRRRSPGVRLPEEVVRIIAELYGDGGYPVRHIGRGVYAWQSQFFACEVRLEPDKARLLGWIKPVKPGAQPGINRYMPRRTDP